MNFYSPTYVAISRALAKRRYTTIAGNTRMHDLGNVEAWRGEKRISGGGYWGVPSEEVMDLAAWIDFAEGLGFKKVDLVGHSAGATAVQRYQAQTQDARVVGMVLASGNVRADTRVPPVHCLPNSLSALTYSRLLRVEGGRSTQEFGSFHETFILHLPTRTCRHITLRVG